MAHQNLLCAIQALNCHHTTPSHQHPSITTLKATLTMPQADTPLHPSPSLKIGHILAHHLTLTPDLHAQTHAYDAAHAPVTKLHKIENYLSDENFYADKQVVLDRAARVLFVETVWLEPEWRGRGLGLRGVDAVIREIWREGEGEVVVMLEPGPVGKEAGDGREGDWEDERWSGAGREGEDEFEATETIARHWMRMGFAAWSYTDEAWLCLSAEGRPEIEDVLAALRGEQGGVAVEPGDR